MKAIDILEFIEREGNIAVHVPIDAGVGELFGVEVLRISGKKNIRPECMEWLKALNLEVWKISADDDEIRIDCKPKKFEDTAEESGHEETGADPGETDKSTDPEEAVGDMNEEKAIDAPAQKPTTPLYSRICTVCGKEFKAKSGATKYCPECKAGKTKESTAALAREIAAMDDEETMDEQEQDNMTGAMNL